MDNTRGICIFAYNNSEIDYVNLAKITAQYVKQHLDLPVTLITDEGSIDWFEQSQGIDIDQVFDDVVMTTEHLDNNPRIHYDSPYTEFQAPFRNGNKHKIWSYSPYEQTILLDVDYIVTSNQLLSAFDTPGVTMFRNAQDIENRLPKEREQYLFSFGIPMWWSTVVAFDRSEFSKLFFETWAHVADNYSYYQMLYNFPGHLFRTDYCVSVAVHILNGMADGDAVDDFGFPMIYMDQKDDVIKVTDDSIAFLSNDRESHWENTAVKLTKTDIHVMNKRAFLRQVKEQDA